MQNNTATPAPRKPRGKPFTKGADPRRHKFTSSECGQGFWSAIESIVVRFPNAIMPDGRHIACNFLRAKGGAVQ